MGIPPTMLTPGLWLTVDLVSGDLPIGQQPRRACIIAPTSSASTLAANTVQANVSADDVAALSGDGTLAHLAVIANFAECPSAQVDLILSPQSTGGTAAYAITFDDT